MHGSLIFAQGVRCQKKTRLSNILISYYLDGDRVLGEDWGDGDTAYTQWRYFYDLNGIAGLTYNNVAYSLVSDVLGNVSFILKGKNVIGKYSYDAYGNCIVTETANISEDERFVVNNNPWRWKGYYYDTESNLYYIRGRYYDPRIMQYIDADTPENIFSALMGVLNGLDRNAVVCNNILLLAINNCTIQTYLEMFAHITEIDKERSTWWMWVLAALIIIALIALVIVTHGTAAAPGVKMAAGLLGKLGTAAAIAAKSTVATAAIAKAMLIGASIAAVVGMVAGGIQYTDGISNWSWEGAAEGFFNGTVYGSYSGLIGHYTGSIGSGLKPIARIPIQGTIGGAVSAAISIFQQAATTGEVDWYKVGISAGIGFVGGLQTNNGIISSIVISLLITAGQAAIEELMERNKSKIEVNIIPNIKMQYAY